MTRHGSPHTVIVRRVLIIALLFFIAKEVAPGHRLSVGHHFCVPLSHHGAVGGIHVVDDILDVECKVFLVDDGGTEVVGLTHVGHIHVVAAHGLFELDAVLGEQVVHLFLGEGFDGFGLAAGRVLLLHEGDGILHGTIVEVPAIVGLVLHHGFGLDVVNVQRSSAHVAKRLESRSTSTVVRRWGDVRCMRVGFVVDSL